MQDVVQFAVIKPGTLHFFPVFHENTGTLGRGKRVFEHMFCINTFGDAQAELLRQQAIAVEHGDIGQRELPVQLLVRHDGFDIVGREVERGHQHREVIVDQRGLQEYVAIGICLEYRVQSRQVMGLEQAFVKRFIARGADVRPEGEEFGHLHACL